MVNIRGVLLIVSFLLIGCSSFGVRTNTQIPYVAAGDNAQIHIHMDGSVPGSEIEASVPIDKIVAQVITRLREFAQSDGGVE